ncbi:MAG: lactate racemase domain-containing protein [Marinilabiliaceae bacterium]|jgi:nickel-dependent lactate racemase|nr:lactate racemase domain-containing protein [Marinilabiliaceae bacterium]
MLYCSKSDINKHLGDTEVSNAVCEAINKSSYGSELIVVPPDITRIHSGAGKITEYIWNKFGKRITDILPALGTHSPMTGGELSAMFGNVPGNLFREHSWRKDVVRLGEVPGEYINMVSEGKLNYPWPVELNRLIAESGGKQVVSIGQVVPHEVIGMANYNKNILIGCGGSEGINKSHYLGAVYGIERIMGTAINPVREVLNFGESAFASHLNILYILTVIGKDKTGSPGIAGLFIGDDQECFLKAAELSSQLNITSLPEPLKKVLVNLNPDEYRSTWLGNKAIYRTRMAMASGGELLINAPGIKSFGEDMEIDRLIRKYGYRPAEEIIDLVNKNSELRDNLAAAAHLIHGSPEGRFNVIYSTAKLDREEIKKVGFDWMDSDSLNKKYNINNLKEGFNTLPDGEEVYYISNPGLGLWKTG